MVLGQAMKDEQLAFFDMPIKPNSDKKEISWWDHGKAYPNFSVYGTTYSGHPTRTTLGNTLRSIAYYKYVMMQSGLEPLMMAAGDDVVMWVPFDKVESFVE